VPELPDIVVYIDALRSRVVGRTLNRTILRSPFVLRTVDPPLDALAGRTIRDIRRLGKRIAMEFDCGENAEPLFLVIHLMIAGRLRWRDVGEKLGIGPKLLLAQFEFDHGTLLFTEAGSKKRASLQIIRGNAALAAVHRGGLEPLDASLEAFVEALTRENHTLKRALTDPRLFSGIGNAYSDEILHAARLSPLKLTRALTEDERSRLYEATRATLLAWIARHRQAAQARFPDKVTAFHDDMAVHGRFKQPCPVCGSPVQRIVYADNECNYCATCQTGGRLLADRALSRLLKEDWPRRLDE
jgi:formamidopyrimidine-DNA glycosylase